jgi:hypothetical protein
VIYFLTLLTDEQLFAIFETIVRARLSAVLKREANHDELHNEEHQIVVVLSQRGHSEKLVDLHRSIRDELFAAWQQTKAAQPVG